MRRLREIPVECIDQDPKQVRQVTDLQTDCFAELCSSVNQYGVLQAVLVRPGPASGRYTLIAGERRLEAARKAGRTTIPCQVEETALDQTEVFLRQLSENLHRADLPHLDLARAFDWLTRPKEQGGGGLRARDLARRLAKSDAFISEHKMLLGLSAEDQEKLGAGTLSFEQARAKLRKLRNSSDRTDTQALDQHARPADTMNRPKHGASDPRGRGLPADGALPAHLENGQCVYPQYSRCYPETNLTLLVAGPESPAPALDCIIRAMERHVHYLKLMKNRHA